MSKKAIIYLEDGSLIEGKGFGASGTSVGEIIFNTGMTGYQEILTDPSYKDQIVVLTYPHIGNYGINYEDSESARIFLSAFVVRELTYEPSNWRAKITLEEFLLRNGTIGVQGVDTRFITRKIRDKGAMKAAVTTEDVDECTLKNLIAEYPGLEGRDLVKYVTCEEPYFFSESLWKHSSVSYPAKPKMKRRIVVLDFGVKRNILRHLCEYFGEVEVLPAYTSVEEILKRNPDGVVLSNGPGDPMPLKTIQENIRQIVGKVPILAICLGHQLLSISLGAKTYKLKFGHHGINHPVRNISKQSIEITSQNHGFAVDPETFPEEVRKYINLTHQSLNDGTFEGFISEKFRFIAVQYHPEAGPGPSDSSYIFDEFVNLIVK